ncbi:glycosyltransferase family 10 [Pelagibacteraceae bacterium]|nr:glycosyltransferase family 10 [Pelagibacteraceae bacterium]
MINKKKNINVLILCQLSYYKDWLVPKTLLKLEPKIQIKELKNINLSRYLKFINTIWWLLNINKFLNANIILLGPFLNPFNSFFLRLIKKIRKDKLIIINHSYENPSIIHKYSLWPYSDFFITPSIFESEKYFRLPFWWEYIKFEDDLNTNRANKRFGRLIEISELLKRKIPFEKWLARKNKLVIIATHLAHPKDVLIENIKSILPIDGYGPIFDKKISNYYDSPFLKEEIIKKYRYDLSFHNSFFPGYIDEKIVEAYASGCIPISNVENNYMIDINKNSYIYFNPPLSKNINEILENKEKLKKIYESPLLNSTPNLNELKTFLLKILDRFRSN